MWPQDLKHGNDNIKLYFSLGVTYTNILDTISLYHLKRILKVNKFPPKILLTWGHE